MQPHSRSVMQQWCAVLSFYIRHLLILTCQMSYMSFLSAVGYIMLFTHTHTHPFNGPWSGTTWVGRYQKKHSPTHTHPDHRTSFINFLHLLRSITSTVFSSCAWQSSLTTSVQVLFGLFLVLDPLLHTPCISSPSHHLLFAAHAHTITACSAVIPMLCCLCLVSLSALYSGIFLLA